MYVWQIVTICASALVSCASLFVAVVLWSSYRRVIAILRSHSMRSALELSTQLTAMQSNFESLSKTVRRLSSRYGMAEKRARDGTVRVNGELPLDELTGAEWRRAARAKYVLKGAKTDG